MWIQSDTSLGDHPKLWRMSNLLGVDTVACIGHLHLLWWWCVSYAPDGDLSDFTPEAIARACRWGGDPKQFLRGLKQSGFLDVDPDGNTVTVHDWNEYTGRRLAQMEEARRRARRAYTQSARRPTVDCAQSTLSLHEVCETDKSRVDETIEDEPIVDQSRPKHRLSPKRFVSPTLDDVRKYAATIGMTSNDAYAFFNYQQASGWKVGAKPMRDWQAAMRYWHSKPSPAGHTPAPSGIDDVAHSIQRRIGGDDD
jgi:hypothetical protein